MPSARINQWTGAAERARRLPARCNNQPDREQRTHQDFDSQAKCNLPLLASLQDEAYIGSGETASVIDAINQRASDSSSGLLVLILNNPNNPILHPGA